MTLHGLHDPAHPDPLMRPMQPVSSKLRRLLFQVVWTVACRLTPAPLHRWRCFVLRCFGAKLGRNNFIYPSARIWDPSQLETGDVATIGRGVFVYNVGGLRLGHHAIVSDEALLCGATHDYQNAAFPLVAKPMEIGPWAWICMRALVLPGVRCGEGAVLGAGAVATRDLDDWAVYAGNPAVKIKARDRSARAPLPGIS